MIRIFSFLIVLVLFFLGTKEKSLLSYAGVDEGRYAEALAFCKKQNLATDLAFFVDMHQHSGKKRFFIVDLKTKKVLDATLCCHGMGKESTVEKPVFSNDKGSNCTSLGKYKTGARAGSNWGIHVHYKMHGLEKTNNNLQV